MSIIPGVAGWLFYTVTMRILGHEPDPTVSVLFFVLGEIHWNNREKKKRESED